MAIPQGPNQRWSLDFMSGALEDGRRFRVLNVIDDFSRECLAAVVDTSIAGARVARELDRIAELRGYPCLVVSDNGTTNIFCSGISFHFSWCQPLPAIHVPFSNFSASA